MGFHHTGIATEDLDRLSQFYVNLFHGSVLNAFSWNEDNEALSLRLGLETSSGRLVMIGFATGKLELFQFDTPQIAQSGSLRSVAKPGLSHVCFQVDDCHAELERLETAGMTFHASALKMPGGGIFAYGRDPDGNVVEILQLPK